MVTFYTYPSDDRFPTDALFPGLRALLTAAEYRPGVNGGRVELAEWGAPAPSSAWPTFYTLAAGPRTRTFAVRPGLPYTLTIGAVAATGLNTPGTAPLMVYLDGSWGSTGRPADGSGAPLVFTFTPATETVTLRLVPNTPSHYTQVRQLHLQIEVDAPAARHYAQQLTLDVYQGGAWRDILPACRAVSTVRGYDPSGPKASAKVGSLTAELVDAEDPANGGTITPGTPVRLRHWVTGRNLFTGTVDDLDADIVLDKTTGKTTTYVTLTATDAVATLANTTRFGAIGTGPDGAETFALRFPRLMTSAPGVPYTIVNSSTAAMAGLVWETKLADHLDAACATASRRWSVDRDGRVIVQFDQISATRHATFTDDRTAPDQSYSLPYTGLGLAFSTRDLVNEVVFENHGRRADPDNAGNFLAEDANLGPYVDTASRDTYGARSVTIPTTIARYALAQAQGIAATIFTESATPKRRPSFVTFQATRDLAATTGLDINRSVTVRRNGTDYPALVATIEHTITPAHWLTTVGLDTAPTA